MRTQLSLILLLALLGCAPHRYTWRPSPQGRVALRIRTSFDPKLGYEPATRELYVETIRATLSAWADLAPDDGPTSAEDIVLQIHISCECKPQALQQADATMELISAFDRDRRPTGARDAERVQRTRLGYDADDMQGRIQVFARETLDHPYSSIFMKSHLMADMDPLPGDARLDATRRAREQAKGLARWIVQDLQRIALLPPAPIR